MLARHNRCLSSIYSLLRDMTNKSVVCFDIDGVLVSGHSAINNARASIELLQKRHIPFVLYTNGSPCSEKKRIDQIRSILGVQNFETFIFMAQTPLRYMTDLHDKNCLFIGNGDIHSIARSVGFKNIYDVSQVKAKYPLLDSVDKSIDTTKLVPTGHVPKLDDDPVNYETAIQIMTDIILTGGTLDHSIINYPNGNINDLIDKVPIISMCTDFLWTTEAPWPRVAVGTFLKFFETYFKMFTQYDIKYRGVYGKPSLDTYKLFYQLTCEHLKNHQLKNIYFIGDNIFTDIYGANSFRRWITSSTQSNLNVKSFLVKSGVYRGEDISTYENSLRFLHFTIPPDSSLLYPDSIFEDSFQAVQHIIQEIDEK